MPRLLSYIVIGAILLFIILAVTGNHVFYLLVVESDSMEPTYEPCDVVISHIVFDTIEEGDIIMYTNPQTGNETVHRIVDIQDNQVQTKGDGNTFRDSYTLPRDGVTAVAYNYPIPTSRYCESDLARRFRNLST